MPWANVHSYQTVLFRGPAKNTMRGQRLKFPVWIHSFPQKSKVARNELLQNRDKNASNSNCDLHSSDSSLLHPRSIFRHNIRIIWWARHLKNYIYCRKTSRSIYQITYLLIDKPGKCHVASLLGDEILNLSTYYESGPYGGTQGGEWFTDFYQSLDGRTIRPNHWPDAINIRSGGRIDSWVRVSWFNGERHHKA